MLTEVEETSPPLVKRSSITRAYVGSAILLLNTLLLLVVLNLLLWVALTVHQARARPSYLKYPNAWYRKVYPGMADADWAELVRETKDRPYKSEPYVMFTDPEYHGRFINISAHGYRVSPQQGPWPMDPKNYNILVFGGSTVFGYGVTDDQTIPANIQSILQKTTSRRVCVYNFGRRAYFSTQERILCEQLLLNGARPNLIIFLDGLNDFIFGVDPSVLPQNRDSITPPSIGSDVLAILDTLPMGQVAQILSKKYMPPRKTPMPIDWKVGDPMAIDHYVQNKNAVEAICKSMGIATVFAFQPTPTYEYDLSNHILQLQDWDAPGDQYAVQGYPLMAEYIKGHDLGPDFIWLADMQLGIHKSLYVDKWHYSAEFSKTVAARICQSVKVIGE